MFTDSYETVDWIQQLVNLIKPQKKAKRSWFKRAESSQEEWDSIRDDVWRNMEARDVLEETCFVCKEQKALVYFTDCLESFCAVCDDSFHNLNPYHDRVFDGKVLNPLEGLDSNDQINSTGLFQFQRFVTFITEDKPFSNLKLL